MEATHIVSTESGNSYIMDANLKEIMYCPPELKPIFRGEMFRNDLDEGPDFYPEYITDSIAYSFIEPSSGDEDYKLMIVHLK
jgi:hypothetical protein